MKYNSSCGEYEIPRTEWLLHHVKEIEYKLIEWYEKNKYSQGDSYYVSITKKGKWCVSHTNDYPMQHGGGSQHVLSDEEFLQATKK